MSSNKKKAEGYPWFSMPKELFRRFSLVLGLEGLAVYSLLASYVKENAICKLDSKKISHKLGCRELVVYKALRKLENLHLIRPKPFPSGTTGYQILWLPPWGKLCGKTVLKISKKSAPYRYDYSIETLREKIDDDIEGSGDKLIFLNYMNPIDQTQLAYELAEALNDQEAIQMYLAYTQRFPEDLLREILTKVLAVPDYKIRKTRGALFNYLIQQHAGKANYYSRP